LDPYIVVFGLGVGMLVGLTGVGGGSLMTPLLIIVFGIKPVTAIGTDIAYAAVTKTVGGYKHWRQKTVDIPLSTAMAFGSVPAAIAGVYTIDAIRNASGEDFDETLMVVVAAAVLLAGTATLARILFMPNLVAKERESADLTSRNRTAAVGVGVFVGFILGVTSAGSGALIAVALILVFRLIPHRVVGTDVFHAAILLWAAGIAHVIAGNVDYGLMGNILVGSIPGIWIGGHLSVRVPSGSLRLALSVVLLGAGLGLLSKAGAVDVPPAVLGAFPVTIGLIAGAAELRSRRKRLRALPVTALPAHPVAD
jgi:uncharacterized membrane protein YfcA